MCILINQFFFTFISFSWESSDILTFNLNDARLSLCAYLAYVEIGLWLYSLIVGCDYMSILHIDALCPGNSEIDFSYRDRTTNLFHFVTDRGQAPSLYLRIEVCIMPCAPNEGWWWSWCLRWFQQHVRLFMG